MELFPYEKRSKKLRGKPDSREDNGKAEEWKILAIICISI